MKATERIARQVEIRLDASPERACRALRRRQPATVFLDGSGGFGDGWLAGPLVAMTPSLELNASRTSPGAVDATLDALDRLVAGRRASGGPAETGVVVLLSYDLFGGDRAGASAALPDVTVLAVDRSIRFLPGGGALVTTRGGQPDRDDLLERMSEDRESEAPTAARCSGRPTTSLPRDAYLCAVSRVQEHITRGDIYQANLCQRFGIEYAGDPFEAYARMARETPAPRSAYVETPDLSLASISPETFLRVSQPGELQTWPIKGTRPRGATPEEDRAAAASLLRSAKDRAELLMIVDLERNDLSRICRAGTVEVPVLHGLRTYAAVHHLVACVRGRLAPGVGLPALLRATFPGGSITGAPKIRAMEILRELEPVPRSLFTGSLFWFGDDGRLDSSILIRSWVFGKGRAWLGAGGGVVADSEPELEWEEANHKARALTRALGFEPEDAA
jgi:anthranilate/para-aminobenzoate synthase component I